MTREEMDMLINSPKYEFLHTNPNLGDNICLLTFGGSLAYGTNLPTSDIDIRGIALNPTMQFFGLEKDFETFRNIETDTVISSLKHSVEQFIDATPSALEMIGCRPCDYIKITDIGQLILDNREAFLSKKAILSFRGFGNDQQHRLEHALLGNGKNDDKRLEMAKHSLEAGIKSFNSMHSEKPAKLWISILTEDEYRTFLDKEMEIRINSLRKEFEENMKDTAKDDILKIQALSHRYINTVEKVKTYIEDRWLNRNNEVERLQLNGSLLNYPITTAQSLLRQLTNIKNDYSNANRGTTSKVGNHLKKHQLHSIRAYMMGTKIASEKDIHVYWEGEAHDMFMDIRAGKYVNEDETKVRPEFYELLDEVKKEFDYAAKNTILDDKPNYEAINEMFLKIAKTAY